MFRQYVNRQINRQMYIKKDRQMYIKNDRQMKCLDSMLIDIQIDR